MKRYLEWRGRPVHLVENITDINDKIYVAARAKGVRSDELAAEMTRAFIDDTDRLGLGTARRRAAGDRDDARDRRADRGADRRGARLRGGRRRLLRRAELRPLRRALGPAPRRGRVRRAGRAGGAQARPGRLRALEGDEARRGHVVALALGRRSAGLAHRVLGDGRAAAGARVRGARRRARPDLPPPRERDRAVVLDRPSASRRSGRTTGMLRLRRREDVEVGGQHRPAPRRARPLGGRDR